jgi:hypothetical protein
MRRVRARRRTGAGYRPLRVPLGGMGDAAWRRRYPLAPRATRTPRVNGAPSTETSVALICSPSRSVHPSTERSRSKSTTQRLGTAPYSGEDTTGSVLEQRGLPGSGWSGWLGASPASPQASEMSKRTDSRESVSTFDPESERNLDRGLATRHALRHSSRKASENSIPFHEIPSFSRFDSLLDVDTGSQPMCDLPGGPPGWPSRTQAAGPLREGPRFPPTPPPPPSPLGPPGPGGSPPRGPGPGSRAGERSPRPPPGCPRTPGGGGCPGRWPPCGPPAP